MPLMDLIGLCVNHRNITSARLRRRCFAQLLQVIREEDQPLPLEELESVRKVMAGEIDQKDMDEFDRLVRMHGLLASLHALRSKLPHEKGGAAPSPARKRKPRGSGSRPGKRHKAARGGGTVAERDDEPSEDSNIDQHQAEAGPSLRPMRSSIHRNHRAASGTGKESEASLLLLSSLGLPHHKENKEPDTNAVVDVDPHIAVPLVPDEPSRNPGATSPICMPIHGTDPSLTAPHSVTPLQEPPIAQPPQLPVVPRFQSLSDYHSALILGAAEVQKATQVMAQEYNATLAGFLGVTELILRVLGEYENN
ncbi:hypothetical protein BS47DRAFT_1343511 [Hydnum rufescens UP504]|uniref:Uncharacterized protein n=1 Tax=Hydnum rufescens UP504 TaxID=1448309 RepID=A0A9P6AYJ9_9AGAM|nr:hypothetical protein BS47DRAFT_1343511 [Hydnum rufescens UP504]